MSMFDLIADRRAEVETRAEEILRTAEAEDRPLTRTETAELEELAGNLDSMRTRVAELADAAERRRRSEQVEARLGLIPAEGQTAGAGLDTGDRTEVRCWLPSTAEFHEWQTRAIASGSNPFLPTHYYQNWFDRLRAASVVLAAGPQIIATNDTSVSVPKITASITVSSYDENTAITAADPTLAATTLTPRKLAGLCLAANEALDDSDPSLRQLVADDLLRQTAVALDDQFLEGNGTAPNMRGVRNVSGVTAGPSLGANGGTPTLDTFADMVESLETANADLGRAAWFMHPRTWATVRQLKDADNRYQLQPDPTTGARRSLFGQPVWITTNITAAETVGTSTDCSWVALADMSQIVVAQRKQVEIEYDRSYRFNYDQTAIRAIARFDIGTINAAGIVLTTGVRG
jgi:HK97 family phage major capsid protein